MMRAIVAGKSEKSDQIMRHTASMSVMVMTVWPVLASVPDTKPAKPRNRATREPLIAVPNFCAIVPLEKMRPVDDVPF